MATENTQKTNREDVLASLLKPKADVTEVEDDNTSTLPDDDEDADEALVTDAEEDDEDDSPTGGDDAGDDDATHLDEDEDESDDEDNVEDYLDVDDNDVISVVVDGQEQETTIGDLKRNFALSGATEKRLQEATELRKTAHAERTAQLENLADQERQLSQVLDSFDDSVFKPVIPAPSDSLRQSNPEQYLRHKTAYDEDQKRIADAKQAIETKKAELQQQRASRLQEYATQASQVIAHEIPELVANDPQVRQTTYQKLTDTALSYGYTQQEIQNALDPRMFMLVRDAMKYREIMSKTKGRDPKDTTGQQTKRVRRLRSGNTKAKNRARQTDTQRKAATEKAKQSGKISDVAATLIAPKPKR